MQSSATIKGRLDVQNTAIFGSNTGPRIVLAEQPTTGNAGLYINDDRLILAYGFVQVPGAFNVQGKLYVQDNSTFRKNLLVKSSTGTQSIELTTDGDIKASGTIRGSKVYGAVWA